MTSFRARVNACFALVYLVWGSSFLVARVGVIDLPPYGVRWLVVAVGA